MARRSRNKKELNEFELERIKERNKIRLEKSELKKQQKKERRNKNKNIKMEEKFLLAVYANFRKTCTKHNIIMSSKYLGNFYTIPIFSLWDIGGTEPIVTLGGSTSIKLEVYEVSAAKLKEIDNLENFIPNNLAMSYMKREEIESPFGKVSIHILNDTIEDNELYTESKKILSGDWVDYKNTQFENQLKLKM